jgi:hypothetical protein
MACDLPALPEAALFVGHRLVPYEIRTFRTPGLREELSYTHDTADYYTAVQLQAYATAAVLADREARGKDAARLDWLEAADFMMTGDGGFSGCQSTIYPRGPISRWYRADTVRELIDAAMGDDDAR